MEADHRPLTCTASWQSWLIKTMSFECDTAQFEANLLRFMSTSKRAAELVVAEQARLLFVEVAKVTPPNGGAAGATLQGVAAQRAGELAIVRDYHQTYGMPGRAYSDLLSTAGHRTAGAFWACVKEGRTENGAMLIKTHLGKSFVPFDGGQAARGLLGKKRKKEPLFYISNPDALNAHVANLRKRVWWLASGWRKPLQALEVKSLPYGVNKQNADGWLFTQVDDALIEIKMTNGVSFAPNVKKLRDRIAFAMRVRSGVLERRWNEYIKRLGPKDGFTIS